MVIPLLMARVKNRTVLVLTKKKINKKSDDSYIRLLGLPFVRFIKLQNDFQLKLEWFQPERNSIISKFSRTTRRRKTINRKLEFFQKKNKMNI